MLVNKNKNWEGCLEIGLGHWGHWRYPGWGKGFGFHKSGSGNA